ncbi:MAG: hypothetical protein GDA36_12555, partial [Rhodobacteraceae bacterium]|nr:hypothetical protein [Paracoccaceae bacterium]
MFGERIDLAILPGPLGIGQSGFGGWVMRLPVFAGQVLPDCCHRQPG